MKNIGITKIDFPSISNFSFNIKYNQTDKKTHFHEIDVHTHSECELYINISGDVSFMVENKIYPMTHGDVIVARPGERHHCIYRSDAMHKFYWILLKYDIHDTFFKDFLNNLPSNYISLSENAKNELLDICNTMHSETFSQEEKYFLFFRMMHILFSGSSISAVSDANFPKDLNSVLKYIDEHICSDLRLSAISKELYISHSTIERRFLEYFGTTPLKFIQKKKLSYAATLLRNGETVLNAGLEVGYTDNSYFIKLFKKYYGVTPFQYKKDNVILPANTSL